MSTRRRSGSTRRRRAVKANMLCFRAGEDRSMAKGISKAALQKLRRPYPIHYNALLTITRRLTARDLKSRPSPNADFSNRLFLPFPFSARAVKTCQTLMECSCLFSVQALKRSRKNLYNDLWESAAVKPRACSPNPPPYPSKRGHSHYRRRSRKLWNHCNSWLLDNWKCGPCRTCPTRVRAKCSCA